MKAPQGARGSAGLKRKSSSGGSAKRKDKSVSGNGGVKRKDKPAGRGTQRPVKKLKKVCGSALAHPHKQSLLYTAFPLMGCEISCVVRLLSTGLPPFM